MSPHSPRFPAAVIGVAHPDSPAAQAKLQTFDQITAVNGRRIERFVELVDALAGNRGDQVVVSYLRPVYVPQAMGGASPHLDPAFYKILIIEVVLALWGGIVGLYCIAEVHRFSAWRAFCTTLIPALIAVVVIGFIVWVVYVLMNH